MAIGVFLASSVVDGVGFACEIFVVFDFGVVCGAGAGAGVLGDLYFIALSLVLASSNVFEILVCWLSSSTSAFLSSISCMRLTSLNDSRWNENASVCRLVV